MAEYPKLPGGMITGLLTVAEKQAAADQLKAKRGPRQCEVCGANNWTLGDYIVSPLGVARVAPGSMRDAPADPYHPSLLLFCDNCGNTKLLNALILGLDIKAGISDD